MPIYEYECPKCGQRASFLEDRDAARRRKCPGCGRRTFARVVSAASFQLKGSGWYATDFRDSGKPKPKKEDGEKKTDDSGGKDGKGAETGGKDEKGGSKKPEKSAKKEAAKKGK